MTQATVYALRDDIETIASIQRATLETEEYGLEPEPALFGSADRWAAIDRGDLLDQRSHRPDLECVVGRMNEWAIERVVFRAKQLDPQVRPFRHRRPGGPSGL